MINRLTALMLLMTAQTAFTQNNPPIRKFIETPKRVIRLDVPMTNSIRKAVNNGTRDFSGKPGPNYWQLEARLHHQGKPRPRNANNHRFREDHDAQQQQR